MNLGELRGAVNRRTRIAVDNAALNEWINAALRELALEDRWPWLELTTTVTLVANQAAYTLTPTNVRTILYVKDAQGNTYDPASIRDLVVFDQQEEPVMLFSDGNFYANQGQQLYIAPTPTAAGTLTVGYITNEPRLIADIDTPLVPEAYQTAVVERAAFEVATDRFMTSGDTRKADVFMANYKRLVQKMQREALRYVGPARTPRIRPGAGW